MSYMMYTAMALYMATDVLYDVHWYGIIYGY